MNRISLYLSKYKSLGLEEKLAKENILNVLKNDFGFQLEKNQIEYKKGNLTIHVTGPLKTEITLKKAEILEKLDSIKNLR